MTIDLPNDKKERFYYRINKDVKFTKDIIEKIKELNPDVDIEAKWIQRAGRDENVTIICDTPLNELENTEGLEGLNEPGVVQPEEEFDFQVGMNGDYLNYNISENLVRGFEKEMKYANPNANIQIIYNVDTREAQIMANRPLRELIIPKDSYSYIGFDADGSLGILRDEVMGHKIDDPEHSKEFSTSSQRFFGGVSRMMNRKQAIQTEEEIKEQMEMEKESKFQRRTYSEEELKQMEEEYNRNEAMNQPLPMNPDMEPELIAGRDPAPEVRPTIDPTIAPQLRTVMGDHPELDGLSNEDLLHNLQVLERDIEKHNAELDAELNNPLNQPLPMNPDMEPELIAGRDPAPEVRPTIDPTIAPQLNKYMSEPEPVMEEQAIPTPQLNTYMGDGPIPQRKWKVKQRVQAKDTPQMNKNESAIKAGLCMLAAVALMMLKGQDLNQSVQNEFNALNNTAGQNLTNIGPIATLLTACAGSFMMKYLKDTNMIKQMQGSLENYNMSMMNEINAMGRSM